MTEFKFECPHCRQRLAATDDMVGDEVECPVCRKPIQVPAALTPPLPPVTKACPYCGEAVLAVAKKCKHCGEIIKPVREDKRRMARQRDAIRSLRGQPTLVPTDSPADDVARCPKCGSTSIQGAKAGYSAGKGCLGILLWPILGPLGLLCGACGKNRMYSHCLKCGHKWKLG